MVDAAPIQIFAAISDDLIPQSNLECHWALGLDIADANAAPDAGAFGPAPFTFTAGTFSGSNEEYGLIAEVDLSNAAPGSEWTLQIRATDGTSETRAPSTSSPDYIGLLYRLRVAS